MLRGVVSAPGRFKVKVGRVYCSVGTPLLRVREVEEGERLKVTLNFLARTKDRGRGTGARFKIDTTGPVRALTLVEGMFEGNLGWQSFSLVAYFEVRPSPGVPIDDVTFDVLFGNGEKQRGATLDGRGRIRDFLLSAEAV